MATKSHGLSGTRFYKMFYDMHYRCNDKDNPLYGGRGIKVCDRWDDFNNFKEDMYASYLDHVEKFGEKDTSIDRIDVNGNYEPNNCKWSTCKEQAFNRRCTRYYSYNGKMYVLPELAKLLGEEDTEMLRCRLKNNNYDVDYVVKLFYTHEISNDTNKWQSHVGEQFGYLKVLRDFRNKKGKHMCECICTYCNEGKTVIVQFGNLRSGNTKSCGCYRRENTGNMFRKGGTRDGQS